MWKFFITELRYWVKAPMTWIFFGINLLLVFGAVSSETISIGGGVGSVHKNAPQVIQTYYGLFSVFFGLLMTTAFMNATANRDFQYNTYQLIFSSPIKKSHYFFGKFLGAYTVSIIPMLAVSFGGLLGPVLGPIFGWSQASRYGAVSFDGDLWGILGYVLPNVFITGVLLFSLALIFRNNIVSFTGAIAILVLYLVSSGLIRDIRNEWLANLLDPFGFRPEGVISKYATVDEKNLHATPLIGAFLVNRVVWVGIAAVGLVALYTRFSFESRNQKVRKAFKDMSSVKWLPTSKVFAPDTASKFSFPVLSGLFMFELKAILRNPTFIIICILGAANLIASLTSFTGGYGETLYPVTYSVIGSIRGAFQIFLIAIITFYGGVMVWRERDAKINEIQDAAPVRTGMLFVSKLLAMIALVAIVLALTIFIGVIAQTCYGYHRYELWLYVNELLGFDLLKFSLLVVIALFFHYLINNRYVAYFAFVAFFIVNGIIWGALQINNNMLSYGSGPSITYSDMNGFGPFLVSANWFNLYWSLFAILLTFVVYAFYVRGKETTFRARLHTARLALGRNLAVIAVTAVLFIGCTGLVYYNTQVLNHYDSPKEQELRQVAYEKQYRKYYRALQPRIYNIDYRIDLKPEVRNMDVRITAWMRNQGNSPITELCLNLPDATDSITTTVAGSKIKLNDKKLGFRILTLEKPLMPGDSIPMQVALSRTTRGFENEVTFTQLTQNGTFFNNQNIMPSLGYNQDAEMGDKNKREKYKLPLRIREPKLDETNIADRMNTYIGNDADWVNVTTTISTAPDQIAIAPGSLVKSWDANGRKYFNYKLDKASLNFYSFLSAKYEVAREKFRGVDIEVYYNKKHTYNVPNMLRSAEKSLQYYTDNFGPYYHKQCRIVEFPRYQDFAQSFPGTMPYSEGIGFITDLRDVKGDDIDFVYYVVAHEIGHQYWAHQLCGSYMQGSEMLSESFAQYSALMVMEKEYGKDKMKKFLKYEMDGYLRGRGRELEAERPIMKTEQQQYIHYQKASVVMYYLKEMIGEDKVNKALHTLLDTYAYKQPPYATSLSAVRAFRKVTPDSLQYLIDDMFENITLFSNRVTDVRSKRVGNEYEVTIKTISEKFRCDSLGKQTDVTVNDYIDIGLFAEGKRRNEPGKALVLQRFKVIKKDNTYTFRTKEKPYQAGIDPYNYLIDRVPDDNLKRVD